MSNIRVALCGIGGYGEIYTRYFLDQNDPRIAVVGVVEPYPERCSSLAELTAAEIPVYRTLEELYAKQQVDLTVIASPIPYHTPQILTALKNGSHVLCEKPLCADEGDIAVLEGASRARDRSVLIGYQWSYASAILALKRDMGDGRFGKCLEMKTVVLWPRDFAYYHRGSGWAGKLTLADGTPVYDSVANNATAHYLHNMMFLLGDEGKSAMPESIRGELFRANDIENFDTCKVNLTFSNGTQACFLASHAVNRTVDPTFHFRFERGDVYYSAKKSELSESLLPADYTEYGRIVAVTCDGERILYGDPFAEKYGKLEAAITAAEVGGVGTYPCGIAAASAHTRVINFLQKQQIIHNIAPHRLVRTEKQVYAEGLWQAMLACWRNPEESLMDWAEKVSL